MTADPLGALVPGTEAAGDADGGDGSLAGVGFVAKDVIDVAGVVTGAGNPDWAAAHEPADDDAVAVAALRAAGAELVAKGQCAELAFSLSGNNAHYGMPRNPAAEDRDPGGSTSGPASAVAGGLCDLGLGTDTLGSVRVPASYCGVYGYRPTHGAIPVTGVLPLAQRFDTVGLLARDAGLLRRAAELLLRRGRRVRATRPRACCSPRPRSPPRTPRSPRARGRPPSGSPRHSAPSSSTPTSSPEARLTSRTRWPPSTSSRAFRCGGTSAPGCGAPTRPSAATSARGSNAPPNFGPDEEAQAEPVVDAMRAAVERLGPGRALVLPASGTAAPPRDADADARQAARVGAGQLTCIATLSGAPAVALPLGTTAAGLPFGVSLVGVPSADRSLLAAAERVAAST